MDTNIKIEYLSEVIPEMLDLEDLTFHDYRNDNTILIINIKEFNIINEKIEFNINLRGYYKYIYIYIIRLGNKLYYAFDRRAILYLQNHIIYNFSMNYEYYIFSKIENLEYLQKVKDELIKAIVE